jgi:hypothetical protein
MNNVSVPECLYKMRFEKIQPGGLSAPHFGFAFRVLDKEAIWAAAV